MLQYLTADLMPGYGLPKKRISLAGIGNSGWLLRGMLLEYTPLYKYVQLPDVIAIGRDGLTYLLQSLHSDGVTRMVGGDGRARVFDIKDLHYYLDF
jgi:hypothetical protein